MFEPTTHMTSSSLITVRSFDEISFNVKGIIFEYVNGTEISADDCVKYANQLSNLQNNDVYNSFFAKPIATKKVISLSSVAQVEKHMRNWRSACVEFKEVAIGRYLVKFFTGDDGRRWISAVRCGGSSNGIRMGTK